MRVGCNQACPASAHTRARAKRSVRRHCISHSGEIWQRHWVHLNVALCEAIWMKNTCQNTVSTLLHKLRGWEKCMGVRQWCPVRLMWSWMFAFVRWVMWSSLFYESLKQTQRSESMWGRQMPSRCQITPNSPLFIRSLSDPPHHHLAKVHKSTPSWSQKAPRDVSVIIKMALPVPNTSLVMCVCVLLHKNICRNTHATWQSEATSFLT